ncbi:hypothetical protein SAMN04488541_1005116 [Thermoflexibacter ruber]|uniref:Uncharacterized protein n=1 Tax=Thermoflexibacter ruber TaxID=1003 RepID=A0A1I2CR18_9BACT|nr:hypothetical protein SAMN04488541_1005116 [Thermoflexibacter ruber]
MGILIVKDIRIPFNFILQDIIFLATKIRKILFLSRKIIF